MPRRQTRGRSLNRAGPGRRTVNNRRARSLNANRRIKNEEIGSGGFGVVSRPPQMCGRYLSNEENFNSAAFRETYLGNPEYISKLTEFSGAEHELAIGTYIKDNVEGYQDYVCVVEFICQAPENKSIEVNGDLYGTYAIAPYCGVPLSKLVEKDIPPPVSVFELCFLVTALQHLTRGLSRLHRARIFHQDIHLENILWDTDTGLMRLIDFGLAQNLNGERIANNSPVIINVELGDWGRMVENAIIPVVNYVLDSDILEKARRKYQYVDDFYYQLREFNGKIQAILNPRGAPLMRADNDEKVTRYLNVVLQFREIQTLNEISNEHNRAEAEAAAANAANRAANNRTNNRKNNQ
jgi:serine/threonine protein kinase